jgi:hypothetical protein
MANTNSPARSRRAGFVFKVPECLVMSLSNLVRRKENGKAGSDETAPFLLIIGAAIVYAGNMTETGPAPALNGAIVARGRQLCRAAVILAVDGLGG